MVYAGGQVHGAGGGGGGGGVGLVPGVVDGGEHGSLGREKGVGAAQGEREGLALEKPLQAAGEGEVEEGEGEEQVGVPEEKVRSRWGCMGSR